MAEWILAMQLLALTGRQHRPSVAQIKVEAPLAAPLLTKQELNPAAKLELAKAMARVAACSTGDMIADGDLFVPQQKENCNVK
jgi:hypothetical protein